MAYDQNLADAEARIADLEQQRAKLHDTCENYEAKIEDLERRLAEAEALAASRLRECEQYAASIKDVFSHDHLDGRIKAEARADAAEAALAEAGHPWGEEPWEEWMARQREKAQYLEARAEAAERERDEARAEVERLRDLTGHFCYCGIPNEPCDGWHDGLCCMADKAPEGSVDRLRARLYRALALLRKAKGNIEGWAADWRANTDKGFVNITCRDRGEADDAEALVSRLSALLEECDG